MQICSIFTFLLVDFGKVLCSSANELQKTQILTILSEIHRLSFRLCGLLSFVCHSYTIAKIMKLLRRPISASDRILDRFCVISVEFLSLGSRRSSSRNVTQRQWARRNICFSQARILDATTGQNFPGFLPESGFMMTLHSKWLYLF